MSEGFEDVEIPKDLTEKIREHCNEAGFDSVSDYVTYVLKQVVSKLELEKERSSEKEREYDREVKEELKNLGYVDEDV